MSQNKKEVENTRRATLNLLEDLEKERRALDISNAKQAALLESIGVGVLAVDKNGNVITINDAAVKILKGKAEDFLGNKIDQMTRLFDKDDRVLSAEQGPLQKAISSGKKTVATYFYEGFDNKKIPVSITVTPVILGKSVVGAIEIFRDITKELELSKAKDEFISLASHQLKGPITAISWGLEGFLLKYKKDLNKEQKETLDKIFEINKGMLELVGGFLDVTRMATSGFAIEKGKVNLVESCNLVIDELVGQISEKKIKIIKRFDKKLPSLDIGEKTARIIFQNLLANAIKYSPENAKVEISIINVPKGIQISIRDYGFGIPDKAKDFIFTKLFRADNAKEKEPSGTGLGLYLVKSMLDKVGGKIKFESKEGVGTTFYVNFKT